MSSEAQGTEGTRIGRLRKAFEFATQRVQPSDEVLLSTLHVRLIFKRKIHGQKERKFCMCTAARGAQRGG